MASMIVTIVFGAAAIVLTWYFSLKTAEGLREIKVLSENMNQLSFKLIGKALDVSKILAETNQTAWQKAIVKGSLQMVGDKGDDEGVKLGIETAAIVGSALVTTGAIITPGGAGSTSVQELMGAMKDNDMMDLAKKKLAGDALSDDLDNKKKEDDE